MISDREVYQCAKQLLDWHGDQAKAEAEKQKARYEAKGDKDGAAVWWRIIEAVKKLAFISSADSTAYE